MYRFIAILLISALLLTGCAKAETDSYIQVIVPEGGGYEAAVTPKPAAPCVCLVAVFDAIGSRFHAAANSLAHPDSKACSLPYCGPYGSAYGYFNSV